jgi:ABC-type antimicrobial peptide transport system permease subunit
VVLRTGGDPTDLVPAVRQRIRGLDPNLPVAAVQTMDQVVARAMARRAFVMSVLAFAGLGALLIGAVGIYGVVSYLVTERTREVGIRMALGATPGRVVAEMVRRSVAVSAVGIVCGLVAASLLGRLMGAVLFEVDPYDPWALAAAAAVLGATAALASVLPARRAGRLDPLESLAAD